MYRWIILTLGATVLILAMAAAAAAQGRGFRGGAIFRAGPPGPVAPERAFIGRPPAPAFGPRVHAGPFGFARFPRTIIVPPVIGYYAPYVWRHPRCLPSLGIPPIPDRSIPSPRMLRRRLQRRP